MKAFNLATYSQPIAHRFIHHSKIHYFRVNLPFPPKEAKQTAKPAFNIHKAQVCQHFDTTSIHQDLTVISAEDGTSQPHNNLSFSYSEAWKHFFHGRQSTRTPTQSSLEAAPVLNRRSKVAGQSTKELFVHVKPSLRHPIRILQLTQQKGRWLM